MVKTQPPPGGFPETPEQSVAYVFSAALVFGIYLSTLVFTLRWTLFSDRGWKRREYVHWPMVFVTIFIFVLTTAYTALDLKGTMTQVRLLRTNPGAPYQQAMWMSITKCIFANSIALSADLVLMYRCYTLYGNRKAIIAFPTFLWVLGIVCTVIQAYLQNAHSKNPKIGPYHWASVNMTSGPGIVLIPFWGSTAALNLYCTILLVMRIRRASDEIGISSTTKQLQFISRTIVESGLIYLSITLAHFVVWFTYDNFAINIVSVLNVPLIGIAFNLILIRAAYSRAEDFKTERTVGEVTTIRFGTHTSHTAGVRQEPKTFDSGNQTGSLSSEEPAHYP